MARHVWGIDIGRSALKAVRVKRLKDGAEITKVDAISYAELDAAAAGDTRQDRGIWQALAEFQARHRVRAEKVVVSVPGGETFIRTLSLLMVGKKSVHELVQYEAQQEIPFVLDEVIWDYVVFDAADPEAREREGLIFAVKKNLLNNYFLSLASANLPVDDVQPTPVALYNFFRHDQDIGEATLVIDVGSDGTNLLAITPSEFWVRTIPVGGSKATELLAKEFGLDAERAEAAKVNLAKSKHAKEILEKLLPAVMELVGEVQKALAYQRTQGKDYAFERVCLVGGGAQLMGLRTMLARSLGMEVVGLEQFGAMRIADDVDVSLLEEDLGRFAVAAGLALHGCGHTACDVSLIPQRAARKTMLARTKPYFIATPAMVLGVLLVAYGFAKYRNVQLSRVYATQVQPQMETIDRLQAELRQALDVAEDRRNIQKIESIGKSRAVWLDLLDELMRNVLLDNNRAGASEQYKVWLIDLDVGLHLPKPPKKQDETQDGRQRISGSLTAGMVMNRRKATTEVLYRRAEGMVIQRMRNNPRFVTESVVLGNWWLKTQLHKDASELKEGARGYYVFQLKFEFYTTP